MVENNSALGICIGASTLKVVELVTNNDRIEIQNYHYINHECDPRKALVEFLQSQKDKSFKYACITGRKFKELLNTSTITELEAIECGLELNNIWLSSNAINSDTVDTNTVDIVLSLGSENFIRYDITSSSINNTGNISIPSDQIARQYQVHRVHTSNKCASGTGSFFLQQLTRMGLSFDDVANLNSEITPHMVSGRCSVFCKSDCTHALNKGIQKQQVLAGLAQMIAEKAVELLCGKTDCSLLVTGGLTRSTYLMELLRQQVTSLTIPAYADVFEALGAAYYALVNQLTCPSEIIVAPRNKAYTSLPPLSQASSLVEFRSMERGTANSEDRCVLGLDVGSTTTKAALIRENDSALIASSYLRTNGDPIAASRACYAEILNSLNGTHVNISLLGVTGSGRHIAGLHAETDAIVNEIIAHATASAFFDPAVDTILEIGGQDAKYTYLVNGVPCDYAMNEACSAGTGSFIEEATKEAFGIECQDIQDLALSATTPPNFNDQCAAFISSDIKNASHELKKEDIIAGLVYSVCMNYNNRVKGSRKVGSKVFMQGGVCYNKAVVLAMASLLDRPIIVPPEPGLMGAFGVALEVKRRHELGLLSEGSFDLSELAAREVSYGRSFACSGATEQCDRGCNIQLIKLKDKNYPFGGICNKYSNDKSAKAKNGDGADYVQKRQDALFEAAETIPHSYYHPMRKRIGISGSFLSNLLYPLYHTFFSELGHEVILPDNIEPNSNTYMHSSFCYPAQIAHGMLANLINQKPDIIFLPQVYELSVEKSVSTAPAHQSTCITVQSEPFYLKSAFKDAASIIATPHINFSKGWEAGEGAFVDFAVSHLNASTTEAKRAYKKALVSQNLFFAERKRLGTEALEELATNKDQIAIVVFGRPYNAFAEEANMGIPRKFTSRGISVIPFDALPFHNQPCTENMTWAMGQDIMRAAHFVKNHPRLFGCFITNFGCGPDSFVVGYFRDIMKSKPSLTLEIDSHTADAGVTTRVEAFLDIIDRYRTLGVKDAFPRAFHKTKVITQRGKTLIQDSSGRKVNIRDKRVTLLLPSMGRLLSEMTAAAFRGAGINARPVPHPNISTLNKGRANTSCKECLPMILTTGSMLQAVEDRAHENEILLYFMPTANGTCRFPQYYVFLNNLIEKQRLKNVATLTLTSENSYGGLGILNVLRILKAIVVSDVMEDIKNSLRVLAINRKQAMEIFDSEWHNLVSCFESDMRNLDKTLRHASARFASIPLKQPLQQAAKVLLAGEIYVRKDEFSSQEVVESLAKKDIIALRAPMLEWIDYVDYWVQHIEKRSLSMAESFELKTRLLVQRRVERKIKSILATSGLYEYHESNVNSLIQMGENFVHRSFGGETILVIGSFFRDMMKHFNGLVSVGPFACLPTRIVEAILTPESYIKDNERVNGIPGLEHLKGLVTLPFLSIESDGNPFPQLVEARLEAFALQVQRITKHYEKQSTATDIKKIRNRSILGNNILKLGNE